MLRAAGFHEAATLSFIERGAALDFAGRASIVAIANPLSEKFAVLRPSLLPGLVDALAYNRRREQRDIRLYESANAVRRGWRTARAWRGLDGRRSAPHWSGSGRPVDVFDLTGVVERLARRWASTCDFMPAERPYLSPAGRAAVHRRRGAGEPSAVGVIGQLLPAIADARGIPRERTVFVFEIDLDALADVANRRDAARDAAAAASVGGARRVDRA